MQNKDFVHTFSRKGVTLTAKISPCVWMFQRYPLQLTVSLDGESDRIKSIKGVTWEQATEDLAITLAESIDLHACPKCGKPTFDPATVSTNAEGLCGACVMADLMAEYEKQQEVAAKNLAKKDAAMKEKGYSTEYMCGCIQKRVATIS